MTDEQIMRVAERFGLPLNLTTANFARALLAAGASEGQAEPVAEMSVARDGRGNTRVTWKTLKWDTSDGLYQLYTRPSAELTALRERIAGMEKDAERWKWLKLQATVGEQHEIMRTPWGKWDEYADAAIAKEKQ